MQRVTLCDQNNFRDCDVSKKNFAETLRLFLLAFRSREREGGKGRKISEMEERGGQVPGHPFRGFSLQLNKKRNEKENDSSIADYSLVAQVR